MKRRVKIILAVSAAVGLVGGLLWERVVGSLTDSMLESREAQCIYYYGECVSHQSLQGLVRQAFPN